MRHTLQFSLNVPMQENEFHGRLPALVSPHHLHQIHIVNEPPCQFQTSDAKLDIWKLSFDGVDFLWQLLLRMDQEDNHPIIQDNLHVDATFEEAKHQFLVF